MQLLVFWLEVKMRNEHFNVGRQQFAVVTCAENFGARANSRNSCDSHGRRPRQRRPGEALAEMISPVVPLINGNGRPDAPPRLCAPASLGLGGEPVTSSPLARTRLAAATLEVLTFRRENSSDKSN